MLPINLKIAPSPYLSFSSSFFLQWCSAAEGCCNGYFGCSYLVVEVPELEAVLVVEEALAEVDPQAAQEVLVALAALAEDVQVEAEQEEVFK